MKGKLVLHQVAQDRVYFNMVGVDGMPVMGLNSRQRIDVDLGRMPKGFDFDEHELEGTWEFKFTKRSKK